MKYFFSFVVPFFIKTVLMLLVWTIVLFLSVMIGVENAWDVMLAGGDLADIIDIDQYLSPDKFISNTAQSFPLWDVITQIKSAIKAGISIELTSHIDIEISKAVLLAGIMYLCGFFKQIIVKISDKISDELDSSGILKKASWADIVTSLLCHIYTIFISMAATNILSLRFSNNMPFYGKSLPFILLLFLIFIPMLIIGNQNVRSVVLKIIFGPIASILAAVCAILFVSMLELIIYANEPNLIYYIMALVFLVSSSFLIYFTTKDMFIECRADLIKKYKA